VPAIRVLVVDDSVVVRRLVTLALEAEDGIEVVGVAANGRIALEKVAQLAPDVVTMDVEMPVLDGIATVRELRAGGHRMPIIMFSTLTERGAAATLDALAAGATDYVTKPTGHANAQEAVDRVAHDLVPRIRALAGRRVALRPSAGRVAETGSPARPAAPPAQKGAVRILPAPERGQVRAVVVGSSTGGPEALSHLVKGLGALPVPVVVVQHMPPVFTTQLAARLDRLGPARVVEAAGGETLAPGTVYVAPGDHHLELVRSGAVVRTRLHQGPPVNYCRPSVDVLFTSAAEVYGRDLLAVVLTGMGSDGRAGVETALAAGARVFAQDEPTSVVWGMPGAVATGPGAHAVLPLLDVAPAIVRAVGRVGVSA
jgi:two-component system chemotaxis response regulator CheB